MDISEQIDSQVVGEFFSSKLCDDRLSERLVQIAREVAKHPDKSFPKLFCQPAELEGAYRFFCNDRVRWSSILSSHFANSYARVETRKSVVVAHDTTPFLFKNFSKREGLGRVYGKGKNHHGFLGHFSLAINPGKNKIPLGLLAAKAIVRTQPKRKKKRDRSERNGPQNESYRWLEQTLKVEEQLNGATKLIHVMDREADAYELYEGLKKKGISFVVRIKQDRVTKEKESKLFDSLEGASIAGIRTVKLSRRKGEKFPVDRKIHPARQSRKAKLNFSAKRIEIKRSPSLSKELSPSLSLNFVHVWEENTPESCAPVDWKLVTTEPIETFEQIEAIVNYYQSRWVIEEYFKAVKTGCAYEQRQQESYHALLNVLAVFLPVAWWLLSLKTLARNDPKRSSVGLVSQAHLKILAARFPDLSHTLDTAEGVLYAVARLGGHIKYNGPPGWQTLYSGFRDLIQMEVGWLLHAASIRRDM